MLVYIIRDEFVLIFTAQYGKIQIGAVKARYKNSRSRKSQKFYDIFFDVAVNAPISGFFGRDCIKVRMFL